VDNDLHRLAKYSLQQLLEFKGVGEARALSIASALELGRRRMRTSRVQYSAILRSSDAFDIVVPYLTDKLHEEVWVLLLNQAGKLLHHQRVSSGGVTHAIVDTKVIMRLALQHSATRMILVHNHPSGSVRPSQLDIKLTQKVRKAAELFDVELTDHLIVGHDRYFSFKDDGLL
jgi:DNA repair protein RadC